MMKRSSVIIILIIAAFSPMNAASYVLPEYQISEGETALPAEEVLAIYDLELGNIYEVTRETKLKEYERNKKVRLSKNERRALVKYRELQTPIRFWNYVVDLKQNLLALPGAKDTPEGREEADLMSKIIVQRIYDISQEYQVGFTALFRNFQINTKSQAKGFCYHYVSDILRELMKRDWRNFDLHWGEAYAKTFRENNALVITVHGEPFDTGLAIDVWRTGGRPFWRSVKGDRFPWKEAPLALYE